MNFLTRSLLLSGILALSLLAGCTKQDRAAETQSVVQVPEPAPEVPAAPALAQPTGNLRRYDAKPGTLKVRIEGTSNIHDWQVEGKIIGGFLEVAPGFPAQPDQAASPGPLVANAEAFIPVRSLSSVEKDGRPYSTKMDDIMYDKLLSQTHSRILFRLRTLTLKRTPATSGGPYEFEAVGSLTVAGVTNAISMPVFITPLPEDRLKVVGSVGVKMTDFKITPPKLAILGPLITTGDEVKLFFEWLVKARTPQSAAAPK